MMQTAHGTPIAGTRLDSYNHKLVKFRRHLPLGIAKGRCDTSFDIDTSNIIVGHLSTGPACRLRPKVKGLIMHRL